MGSIKILRGNFIHAVGLGELEICEGAWCVIENGRIREMLKSLPTALAEAPVVDTGPGFIIPAFSDIHVHAPHLPYAGVGFDEELMPWLKKYTFPLESRFADGKFAETAYREFIRRLWRDGTLHSCVFATLHRESTALLFDLFRQSGLSAYIGKVNMDRNGIPGLSETADQSIEETIELIGSYHRPDGRVRYVLTPRFVPSTSDRLMRALGDLSEKYRLPVQSHLDENRGEIALVREMYPGYRDYADVYDRFGLMPKGRTIMAHCVYLSEREIDLLSRKEVMVAHCAQSNADLASGIMPLRKYLDRGLRVGIGSDVGGAHVFSMQRHVVETVQASKLRWVGNEAEKPVSVAESFSLATRASGSFFGNTGSFAVGNQFDALVIDDSALECGLPLGLRERLERFLYTGDDRQISARYLCGEEIPEPFPKAT